MLHTILVSEYITYDARLPVISSLWHQVLARRSGLANLPSVGAVPYSPCISVD